MFSTDDVFSSGMIHGGCNWRLKAQFICDVMEFIYQPFHILRPFDRATMAIGESIKDYSMCYLGDRRSLSAVTNSVCGIWYNRYPRS